MIAFTCSRSIYNYIYMTRIQLYNYKSCPELSWLLAIWGKGKLVNGSGGRLRKRICFAQRGLLSGLAFAFYSYFPRKGQVLFLNPCS